MASDKPWVNAVHNPSKAGLGRAYIKGFKWALMRDYELIFEMDADFSHDPVSLPQFVEAGRDADYVVGARYVPGGCTLNWGVHRRLLSRMGNTFARLMLSAPVHDLTTGYRLVRVSRLDDLALDTISAKGYGYLIAMTFRAVQKGLKIKEVPIRFLDRRYGASKMSANIIQEAFQLVVKLRAERGKG
jgi:dolichol-phosphate mannosyltransferase